MLAYPGADACGRYQRMRGWPVFQPTGFDAFGIHTENIALKTGQHPMRLTARTIEAFRGPAVPGWYGMGLVPLRRYQPA